MPGWSLQWHAGHTHWLDEWNPALAVAAPVFVNARTDGRNVNGPGGANTINEGFPVLTATGDMAVAWIAASDKAGTLDDPAWSIPAGWTAFGGGSGLVAGTPGGGSQVYLYGFVRQLASTSAQTWTAAGGTVSSSWYVQVVTQVFRGGTILGTVVGAEDATLVSSPAAFPFSPVSATFTLAVPTVVSFCAVIDSVSGSLTQPVPSWSGSGVVLSPLAIDTTPVVFMQGAVAADYALGSYSNARTDQLTTAYGILAAGTYTGSLSFAWDSLANITRTWGRSSLLR